MVITARMATTRPHSMLEMRMLPLAAGIEGAPYQPQVLPIQPPGRQL